MAGPAPVAHARPPSARWLARAWRHLRPPLHVLLDASGKAWSLPNTLVGLLLGGAGRLFGGEVSLGHNAIEFRRSPLMDAFTPGGAITLGNVILYGSRAYGCADHERIHTLQGQFAGPAYLPLNAIGMLLSLLSWPIVRLRRPGCGPFHGRLNFMEGWPRRECLYGEAPAVRSRTEIGG